MEAALATVPDRSRPYRVLDLGTGTGCLLLAVLSELPRAFGVGIDRVREAAVLASRNAAMLGLGDRAAFLCGDWAESINGRFDMVLCNPPYVPSTEINRLMPDVARCEPSTALDGGVDGLAAYSRVIPALSGLLGPGGAAVLEIGQGAASPIAELASAAGLTTFCREDLAGVPRAMTLCQRGVEKTFGSEGSGG